MPGAAVGQALKGMPSSAYPSDVSPIANRGSLHVARCRLSPHFAFALRTLAAAYAETGDWGNAIKQEKQAIAMATNRQTKEERQLRLKIYKAKMPYREDPAKAEYKN